MGWVSFVSKSVTPLKKTSGYHLYTSSPRALKDMRGKPSIIQNKRPLYPQVAHNPLEASHNSEPLALSSTPQILVIRESEEGPKGRRDLQIRAP